MRYYYKWYHIKTGKHGLQECSFDNEITFLQTLNRWNQGLAWKYVALSETEFNLLLDRDWETTYSNISF